MSNVLRPSQHFPGLHTSVPWGLYSCFRIIRGIYIWRKKNPDLEKTSNDSKSFSMNERNVDSAQYF